MEEKKNKKVLKTIMIIVLLIIVVGIGITIAYFTAQSLRRNRNCRWIGRIVPHSFTRKRKMRFKRLMEYILNRKDRKYKVIFNHL